MTELTFFRHGQAGSRLDYDQLSAQGEEQSRLLGRYLAASGARFEQVVCGDLRRQRRTCEIVYSELDSAGVRWPEPVFSGLWNEFDLDLVYEQVGGALAAADPGFAAELESLRQLVALNTDGIHRRWTDTDSKIIHAWVGDRFELPIESWSQFRARILSAASSITAQAGSVAVFTSATPVGVWVGSALGLDTPRILRLAGAQYNTAMSRVFWSGQEAVLSSFNETPHLPPGYRTLR